LKIDAESIEKFLNQHQEIVRVLHAWILERTGEMDIEALNHLKHFFGQFFTQAVMMIQQEFKAMQRPMS
jgi:hypothetical protein